MKSLHSLLKRQLRRFSEETIPLIEGGQGFLRAINEAYWQFDEDRQMLEHSLELMSQELLEKNAELTRINAELEMRVAARTAELSSSEARFRGLFEHAPISLWEENFSAVYQGIEHLREAGVEDFAHYFDEHPEFVAECARRVKIVDVNRATLEMYRGDSKSQLLADLSKVLGPESLRPFKAELLALERGETSYENETVNYTLHGERRYVFIRLTVAPGYEQTWAKVFVGISDITERRRAEASLAAERDLLQALMDNIPDTIYFKDTASRFTRINRAQVEVLGVRSAEEAIGKTDLDFQDPNLARGFYEEEQHLVQTGQALINRVEFNPTPDGEPRWFSATKVPIKNETGQVIGLVGISRDITKRTQAEQALQEAETKYRLLVENMPGVVYVDLADESRKTIYINARVQDMLGYSSEDWITKPDLCLDIVHPDDSERMWRELDESEARGRFAYDYRYLAKDGRVVWVRDEAILLKNKAGEPSVWQGVMLDITAQKETEEALRRSEERFRLVSWVTTDAVWDWDFQANRIEWGAGLQKIFHYPPDVTHTDSAWWLDHIHPEDRSKVERSMNKALENGLEFWSKEYRFQRADHSYAIVMDRGYIIRNEAGKPYRLIGAMVDITERRQAEDRIRQQNDMLSSLHHITLNLLRYREVSQLLSALVEFSAAFLDAPYAEIMLLEADRLVVKAATQSQPQLMGRRMGRQEAILSWRAFDTREPAVLSDYANWPQRQPVYEPLGLHAVADFPILNEDQCLGVLALGRDLAGYEFTGDQIQFGRFFANLTALVLNNAQLREALQEKSIRDPLTGLFNRRYMEETLKREVQRVTRQLHPLGIIMVDIDHFKHFNDAHGHRSGDELLQRLGQFLQAHIRGDDVACRYGGEEFLLILPNTSLETAYKRAESLRQEAKKLHLKDSSPGSDGITLSLGIAIYPEHGHTMETILRAADSAMYRAKQAGRDQVMVAEHDRAEG